MTSNHVGDFSAVVSEFPALIKKYREELYTNKKKDSNPTFFEVIGKENSETVMVNTLAFFLKPNNNHGFADRVYQTFCEAIENSIIENNIEEEKQYQKPSYGSFKEINTEISHENNNGKKGRLDLIIETDNCIIGVEAKINHSLNNPLHVYDDLIDKRKGKKYPKKIILCKRGTNKLDYSSMEEKDLKKLCNERNLENSGDKKELQNRLKLNDWPHVNWEDILIDEIDSKSDYLQLWQGMKKAFKDDEIMKDEQLEIIKDEQKDYLKMYKIVKDISKAMEKKANRVKNEVVEIIKKGNYKISPNVRVWGNFSQSAEPRVVIERIGKKQKKFVVDIITSPKGYRFVAFSRDKNEQNIINDLLENNGYKIKKWQDFLNDKNPTERALITEIPDTTCNNLVCDSTKNYVFYLNYDDEKDTKLNKDEEIKQIAKIGVKIYEQICN